jgi:hypothetical protein
MKIRITFIPYPSSLILGLEIYEHEHVNTNTNQGAAVPDCMFSEHRMTDE